MPINRAPYNALVDDAGTGTTGTPWNKQAIKDVLLDPVDAAIAGVSLTRLASASGSTVNTGAENLTAIALPVLALTDQVLVHVTATYSGGTAPIVLDLTIVNGATDNGGITLTGTTGAGDFNPNNLSAFTVSVRPALPGGASTLMLAYGGICIGGTQTRGFPSIRNSGAALTNPNNVLMFRQMSGVPAAAQVFWTWSVYLLKG